MLLKGFYTNKRSELENPRIIDKKVFATALDATWKGALTTVIKGT